MRLIGVLSWYDESPHWLSTAVAGVSRFCDYLVAVDGAYALFPRGRPRSHPQQVEAIVQTAEATGLGLLLHQPQTTWRGNELEKRNFALDLAGTIAREDDWLLVFDADYHLLQCEPEVIRASLENCPEDVATYLLLDGKDFLASAELEQFAASRHIDTEWTQATRDIYRWNPTLRVGPAHWCYSVEAAGERRWLRGPYEDLADCLDLNRNLAFYHRTQDRAQSRRRSAEMYYHLRDQHQIETTDLVTA